jgi:hypothetical protein
VIQFNANIFFLQDKNRVEAKALKFYDWEGQNR